MLLNKPYNTIKEESMMKKHNAWKRIAGAALSLAIAGGMLSAGGAVSAFAEEESEPAVIASEQVFSKYITMLKIRLANGFSSYSEKDKVVYGAFNSPQYDYNSFSAMWYLPYSDITADNAGYAITDLDGDGWDELVLGKIEEDGTCEIYDIYTRYEGSAWHIAAASERDHFYVTNRNTIVEEGSVSAFCSTRVFYDISKWQLTVIDAYKSENGKNYKMTDYTADEESGFGYTFTWKESEEKGEDFSYQPIQFKPISEFKDAEPVLLKANIIGYGHGEIAGTDDGTKPEFDPERPMQSAVYNMPKGTVINLSAKADDGSKFMFWMDEETNEVYSEQPDIIVTLGEPLSLEAVFDLDIERVPIRANTYGGGRIAGTDDGSEPEIDPDFPYQSIVLSVYKGYSASFLAEPEDGWEFVKWHDKNSHTTYSTDKLISVEPTEPFDLVAVFKAKDDDSDAENITSDFDLADWAEKDYEDKTNTNIRAEISEETEEGYTIVISDEELNTLDTYSIDPKTGTGTNSAGEAINLPQTGMSGAHRAVAAAAALLMLAGAGLVIRNRKDEK